MHSRKCFPSWTAAITLLILSAAILTAVASAQNRPAQARGARGANTANLPGVSIMDQDSIWRIYHVLKPPVVDVDGKLQAVVYPQNWLNTDSPPAPANWTAPDFDDSTWSLRPARSDCATPYLAELCLRGKFAVTDPGKVRGLAVDLACNGGAVVYLNGKEIARDHAVSDPKGNITYADAPAASLADIALPASGLRQGVNVLAIEIVRAPFVNPKSEPGKRETSYTLPDDACRITHLQLAAPSAGGLLSETARPAGIQIWNGDVMDSDFTVDFANPCEKLEPVKIIAARNGSFSGKIVVGSARDIAGLNVTATELRAGAASIPASDIQIRYGIPWGAQQGSGGRPGGSLLGAVLESPLKVFPATAAGAVVPIWITVKPPKTAAPGDYSGEIKVSAAGLAPVSVPLHVKVMDYLLADPDHFRTVIELIESPDTLSLEYKEPLWSAKNFEMIGESFRLMSPSGSRFVHIPAIAHTNLGNAESMIRWIKTGENQYDFDYSIMDQYLDVAAKNLGTPKVVVLQVWDLYMASRESIGKRFAPELDARHEATQGGRPEVTLLDKATGKTELGTVPDLSDPASKAIWTKLITGVRRHLQKRGLEKTLMFGMFTDAQPPKEHIQFFHDIAPDVPWVQEGHGRLSTKVYKMADIGYQASVWGCQFADGQIQQYGSDKPIPVTSLHGWKLNRMDLIFERNTDLDSYPLSRWHFYPETAITGETRGLGRIGADYWKVIKDKQGRRRDWADERFPEGSWGGNGIQLNLCSSVLAPGPAGPVATTRLLSFCEGLQESEARITIEQALTDEARKSRLGADLAKRCQTLLDDRLDVIWKTLSDLQLTGSKWGDARLWRWVPGIAGDAWFSSFDWQDRNEKLFALAAEVQKRVGP